ncbi:hypothetical protein A2380_02625 [candidate division WWE3 bacterium RIFOXYB1_FULL_43_24]|uniref:Uncharacterized protein n=2 Tax=Katanobacteria TaxID=422282 RepID=A0A0G1AWF9_UNCKA|nr:MAG: hypothetical protein UU92_C0007G0084 [candidate division WWE3 bacterium GW2011_GWA1_42_12]KKS34603.1 MAG: hypothetical protein UU97_C0008G0005 [candidate division WWE3 bacterium GW2011_GWD1_42_14]KKS38436.1 MAG: hypothetical protein UV00_C0007G0017 [candidate division WWE3 bacterium GW2011_GWF1_42_14]KKS40480.1 MAG: hypothetical protein UV03_C0006G0012 [candidate division WWE3 bacterium GW2011_GWE1_42_16]KKS66161.1 MAG: hypothetical protein UV35_C0024G0005 [candidate division WWE3 bacte
MLDFLNKPSTKLILGFLILGVLFYVSSIRGTFAAESIGDPYGSTPAGETVDMDNPTWDNFGNVLVRILNWAVYLVGIVFVLVIAYGAWKASMALGDPRGLDSAKNTWTYALFGALIIGGFFAIFTIVSGLFGFKIGFADIFSGIIDGIKDFTEVSTPPPSTP